MPHHDHHHSDSPSRLAAWFARVGIRLHPHLEVRRDAHSGLGLYATAPLSGDIEALTVPSRICISSPSARSAIASVFPTTPTADLKIPAQRWAILYIFLVRLLSLHPEATSTQPDGKGSTSSLLDHLGYIDALPKQIAIPLLFRPAELQLLKATPLYAATVEKLRQTEEEHASIRSWLAQAGESDEMDTTGRRILEVLRRLDDDDDNAAAAAAGAVDPSRPAHRTSLELYRWSNAVSLSRAFPPSLLPGLDDEAGPVLIPGLDLPNHARSTPVTWSSSSHATGSGSVADDGATVTLVTRYPIASGEEVVNNYGPKSNEELLSSYAFVLEEGEDDFLSLKLGDATSAGESSEVGGQEAKTYRWLRRGEGPPDGLLDEIRERIARTTPSHPPHSAGGDGAQSEEIEKLQEDGETLETLELLLVQKRKAFRRIDAEIEEMLSHFPPVEAESTEAVVNAGDNAAVRRSVWDMVRVYRQGQLTILNQAIRWTRAQLELVADKLDELYPDSTSNDDDDIAST